MFRFFTWSLEGSVSLDAFIQVQYPLNVNLFPRPNRSCRIGASSLIRGFRFERLSAGAPRVPRGVDHAGALT